MTIICPKTNRVCENTGCSEWKSCLSYTPSVAIPLHKEETPAHQEEKERGFIINTGTAAPAHQTGAKDEFLPPDGEWDWTIGAEMFSRKEVFNLLWTQRAMISNDLKKICGNSMSSQMYEIINDPRIPKF